MGGGDASRAMDGNTVGIYNWNTVTHTNWNVNPYYSVWLGTDATINKVYFWNRIDCCRNRLSNVKVEVLDGIGGGDVVESKSIAGQLPVMNVVDFGGITGQTVKITITQGGHTLLSLAEVHRVPWMEAPMDTGAGLPSRIRTMSPIPG